MMSTLASGDLDACAWDSHLHMRSVVQSQWFSSLEKAVVSTLR